MEYECQTDKDAPQHYGPTANNEQYYTQQDWWDEEEPIKQNVIAISYEVGSVAFDRGLVMVLRGAPQDPADVRPESPISWRVWIVTAVCVRVMNAMGHGPLDWSTLGRQRSTRHQKIFQQLWDLICTVRNQAMKTHSDTETAGNPVQNHHGEYCRPTPEKERHDRTYMRDYEERSVVPIDLIPVPREPGFVSS